MGLAGDAGGLLALGVGVHILNDGLKKSSKKLKGWRGDSVRHSLARKGIRTSNKTKKYKTYKVKK